VYVCLCGCGSTHLESTLPTDVVAANSLSTSRRLLKRFFIQAIISRHYLRYYWHHPASGPYSSCTTKTTFRNLLIEFSDRFTDWFITPRVGEWTSAAHGPKWSELTYNKSTQLYIESQRRNYAPYLCRTMNYSAELFDCWTIYCTHYYHHHSPPHNAITSDTVRTPYSCLNIQHIYPVLIS